MYSSSLIWCAIGGVPSWIGGSIGRFGFVSIVPWLLMRNWCATLLTFTRHGGFGMVGSLVSPLIVCHALLLLCVRSVEVITCSQLFFFIFVVVYPLPWPLLVGGVRCSRLWSTSQQCSWRDDVCRVCGCYRGGIVVMDVFWRRLCVSMIWGREICLFELGKGATSEMGKSLQSC